MNSEDRSAKDTQIDGDDFARCGWRSALEGIDGDGYRSIASAFSKAADKALESGREKQAGVFRLLANVCFMQLRPESINEPFRARINMLDGRSAVLEDFTDTDLIFLQKIVGDIDEPWLKARVADLIWLRQRPRDHQFALMAIDAYSLISLDPQTWLREGDRCWARAASLAQSLKSAASDRLDRIECHVFDVLAKVTADDGFFGYWLAETLAKYGLGADRALSIAEKLESLANELRRTNDLHRAREYFGCCAKWFERANQGSKAAKMLVALAESYAEEAKSKTTLDTPIHALAATLYEDATNVNQLRLSMHGGLH